MMITMHRECIEKKRLRTTGLQQRRLITNHYEMNINFKGLLLGNIHFFPSLPSKYFIYRNMKMPFV